MWTGNVSTIHLPDVGSTLDQRLGHWTIIEPAFRQYIVFSTDQLVNAFALEPSALYADDRDLLT